MRAMSYSGGLRTSRIVISSPCVQPPLQLFNRHLETVSHGRALRLRGDAAELLVVDQLPLRRVFRADRALGVLAELELAELHLQRVEQQQPADQRVADPDDQLDDLVGLERADDPGQHAEHAALGAGRHQARRRRLREEAAVARPLRSPEDRDLALETEDRAVDVGLAQHHAGVVDQVAGREVVGPVHDEVVVLEQVERVAGFEPGLVRDDPDVRVDPAQALGRGFDLGPAHVLAR